MPVPNGLNPTFGGKITSHADAVMSSTAKELISLGASNFVITAGVGAPSHTATKGSLYARVDGSSTSTRLYINLGGTAEWTSVTTGA